MKGAGQIDRDDRVPFFSREVLYPCDVLNARVVDQNIDLAKFGGGVGHHVGYICGLAHVGVVMHHFHAQCSNFSFGAGYIAKAIHNDIRSLGGQRFGDAQANAAC